MIVNYMPANHHIVNKNGYSLPPCYSRPKWDTWGPLYPPMDQLFSFNAVLYVATVKSDKPQPSRHVVTEKTSEIAKRKIRRRRRES